MVPRTLIEVKRPTYVHPTAAPSHTSWSNIDTSRDLKHFCSARCLALYTMVWWQGGTIIDDEHKRFFFAGEVRFLTTEHPLKQQPTTI